MIYSDMKLVACDLLGFTFHVYAKPLDQAPGVLCLWFSCKLSCKLTDTYMQRYDTALSPARNAGLLRAGMGRLSPHGHGPQRIDGPVGPGMR